MEPCPICKTDTYLNPNMILLVNLQCFHKLYPFAFPLVILSIRVFSCESCINRLYGAGSAPCPMCKTNLRKTDFIKPTFENAQVEKECRIRKRIGKVYIFSLIVICLISLAVTISGWRILTDYALLMIIWNMSKI